MNANPHAPYLKFLTIVAIALMAMVMGYLLVYWWVFGNFQEVLNVSALRSQVVSQQNAADVQAQLEGLGYQVDANQFFNLNNPQSTNYRADALGGYIPQKTDETPSENAYYFYDETGQAYFFQVDEQNLIDPDSFIPLIQH